MKTKIVISLLAYVPLFFAVGTAPAQQDYPSKPIRMIVGVDPAARRISSRAR